MNAEKKTPIVMMAKGELIMSEFSNKILKPCPKCGEVPMIAYACGEYFILPVSKPVGACFCSSFAEMHASEDAEADAWNRSVENEM